MKLSNIFIIATKYLISAYYKKIMPDVILCFWVNSAINVRLVIMLNKGLQITFYLFTE